MHFGPNISVGRRGVSYGDSDAQAFIAATGLTGTTEVNAVNNLVANLKSYGLWSKMKAIYPFVSDTVNLLSYSQDYANAYWSKNTTITSNATTAPDGTNTGVQTSGAGNIYTLSPTLTAQQYSVSVYAKANTATSFELNIVTAGFGLGFKCAFNLSTGTAGAVTNYGGLTGTATITNAGNGWYRCTLSGVLTAAQYYYQLTTNANALYIWGSQLETGALTTYQPIATTPANRFVSQFKYNLKDARDLDAAFRLAFNGTWTYSKQGATPNGVNAYADTFLIPSTALTLNNTSFGYYSRTNSSQIPNASEMAVGSSLTQLMYLRTKNLSGNAEGYSYNTNPATVANANSQGLYNVSRISDSSLKLYKNGSLIASLLTTQTGTLPSNKFYLGAVNYSGTVGEYSNKQVAFAHIGNGLTDTEATNLYTSVQSFQTALSRQV
jgi:hypothetical protein